MEKIILIEDLGMMYPNETSKKKRRYGIFMCFCGVEFKAQTADVKNGNTKSCGCYHKARSKETHSTHGLRNHRLYSTWDNMIRRCNNKNFKDYIHYGGRGITVCERWMDIHSFIEDMYPSFIDGLTIDRIDNDKGYCKDNCRWATMKEQSNNRRIRKDNKTGIKGIYFNKATNKYVVQPTIDGKQKYLGLFETLDEAKTLLENYTGELL